MDAETPLCRQCGGPTRLSADGRHYQCRRAPDRHPAFRAGRGLALTGGWGWALGAAAGLSALAAPAWYAALQVPALREPVLVATGLALTGLALGAGPAFAFRMYRPTP